MPLTGFLLDATGSWLLVFGVAAAHYLLGALLYALWVGDRPLELQAEAEALGRAV